MYISDGAIDGTMTFNVIKQVGHIGKDLLDRVFSTCVALIGKWLSWNKCCILSSVILDLWKPILLIQIFYQDGVL